jgi:hypothetical protein
MLQRRDVEDRESAKHAVHLQHTMLAVVIMTHEHLAAEHGLGKTVLRIRHP